MKKTLFILMLALGTLSSCGNDSRDEDILEPQQQTVQDTIPTLSGEFIYLADAAVLKGDDFIYEVKIDSTALDLAEKIRPFKKEDFDMVPVVVKGKISQNPKREGWNEIIEIREVLEIPSEKDSLDHPTKN